MTGGISPSVANRAASKTTELATKGNWVMGMFMAGAVALTYKLGHDTYVANEPREDQGVASERTKKDYALTMYDAGSMSGKGKFWDWARHFGKSMELYGPYGIKEDYQEFKDKFHSIWKEVILPNLIPIGISVASIYGFFGAKAVHKPFIFTGKKFGEVIFASGNANKFTGGVTSVGKAIVNRGADVLRKAFEYPAVAAGLVFLSAFGLKTWYEVDTGRAQDEYFRHELFVKDGKEE